MFSVRVQADPFDVAAEMADLSRGRTDVGALVTFTGLCRADLAPSGPPSPAAPQSGAAPLAALVLEHYPGMAEEEMLRLVAEARARWPLTGARIIHRHGRLEPGDLIVLVVTASAHREAAFSAAAFLMDWLKTSAPFWKKEERADGGDWVAAKATDDAAAERWRGGGS
ncbi:MAG: molybdenum cofactor biosynthesis protein MoaE [Rhizobiales bacterium 32-66-8]|nr:MAG: molybdenum cofactor biosynthesis protein MoaE [Rhizobiales bacterium 32-66-8]